MICCAASGFPSDLRTIREDLVERVEDLLEPLENMDARLERLELVLQPSRDDLEPEVQEVPEHRVQIEPLRPPDVGCLGGNQAGEVPMKLVCSGVCLNRNG